MGVLETRQEADDCGPSGIGGVLNPFVRLPSGTSKTSRSLLLEVSSSTINKPSEYMTLKNSTLLRSTRPLLETLPDSINRANQNQIQDCVVVGTNCRLQN